MNVNIGNAIKKNETPETSEERIVLETKNLNFYYTPEVKTLKNINISIPEKKLPLLSVLRDAENQRFWDALTGWTI